MIENDELKEIHEIKEHFSNKVPIGMEYTFMPKNPYAMDMQSDSSFKGELERPGFFETAAAEFRQFSGPYSLYKAYQRDFAKTENFNPFALKGLEEKQDLVDLLISDQKDFRTQEITPTGWNPKDEIDKLENIQPQNMAYLLDADGPKDFNLRLNHVLEQQQDQETLANGSFMAKLLGGATGILADPSNLIPIGAIAKYGKIGAGFLKNVAKAAPGMSTYAAVHEISLHANKINTSTSELIHDIFIDSIFGTMFIGGIGAVPALVDKMALWEMRKFAKAHIDGIDFKNIMNEKGQLTGFKAEDSTGNLSAAQVRFWQDLADSSFYKGGVFKIPYVNSALLWVLSNPVLGSPVPRLLNSSYQTVRAIADRAVEHGIITKGIQEGKASPIKFNTLLQRDNDTLRMIQNQFNALHLERNGVETSFAPINGIKQLGLGLYNKTLKQLKPELEKSTWVSRDTFYDEVQKVLRTKEPSEHGAVNEAASLARKQIDHVLDRFLKAYDLPKDWINTRTAEDYLMRVYNTPYMNTHENEWISTVSNWYKKADEVITTHMRPIEELSQQISELEAAHRELIKRPNIRDKEVKLSSQQIENLKVEKRKLEEDLQNELRSNDQLDIHVEDPHALSANEANEIMALTKKRDIAQKEVEERRKIVQELKSQGTKTEKASLKKKTAKGARRDLQKETIIAGELEKEEAKLVQVERELAEEEEKLRVMMAEGSINKRLYYKVKDTNIYQLKDPNNRLKFREKFTDDLARTNMAKNIFQKIMNQTPEDTINQVMGSFLGKSSENPLMSRSFLIPDEVLYSGNFMTKDLMAKLGNYTNYLGRRTHLKNVYKDVTIDGGFEPMLQHLHNENENFRFQLNEKRDYIQGKLKDEKISDKDKKKYTKELLKTEKELEKNSKRFETAKKQTQFMFEKMMGVNKLDKRAQYITGNVMAFTAWSSLQNMAFAQVGDIAAMALQSGLIPFIKDGIYPVINSLAGILKTKESESLRKTAGQLNLALQHVLYAVGDRNNANLTNPYLNLGSVTNTIDHIAHHSSLLNFSAFIDNGIQYMASNIGQGTLMRNLLAYKAGRATERELLYLRKYGIDPKIWADRMIKAFKKDGGGTNKLGGIQSLFWKWEDIEAANAFSDATYRSVKDMNIQANFLDSPMWMDPNSQWGVMGPLLRGFKGWMYASVNHYVIPSLQKPDAQALTGVLFMLGMGAMVSPLRRMARGEDPYPPNQTAGQLGFEIVSDSGVFSYFTDFLQTINVFTNNALLGNLKNDRYRDRSMIGLLGPTFGKANMLKDVLSMIGTGEINQVDLKKMVRLMPYLNAPYFQAPTKWVVEGLNIPETRAQAHAG